MVAFSGGFDHDLTNYADGRHLDGLLVHDRDPLWNGILDRFVAEFQRVEDIAAYLDCLVSRMSPGDPMELDGISSGKVKRLNAVDIYSIWQLAQVNLNDIHLCRRLSKNQVDRKAVGIVRDWKQKALKWIARRQQLELEDLHPGAC